MVALSHILELHLQQYIDVHSIGAQELKVARDIMRCRTAECGQHPVVCTDCGTIGVLNNSCRNRHCPSCQDGRKHQWMQKRQEELLPVKYFHIVFTVPHSLNGLFMANTRTCYGLLFEAVWSTLAHFAADRRWLGAHTGCIALLHTWGQNLAYHPHIHCIVPSGGLTDDGMEWRHTRKRFFAPVGELSAYFRGQLLSALQRTGSTLKCTENLDTLIEAQANIKWVVYAQAPFAKAVHIVKYLSNYTHKVAITNHRIVKLDNGIVTFRYKDYKDKGTLKLMELPATEFIRRFLMHVLPHNFYKIRHYGLFANRNRGQNIEQARSCLRLETKEISAMEDGGYAPIISLLPHGLACIGRCEHCGGVLISLYQWQIKSRLAAEALIQSG